MSVRLAALERLRSRAVPQFENRRARTIFS